MGFCKAEMLFHIYPKNGFYDGIENQYGHILKFSAI